jgi:hypothetical protein
MLCYGNTKQIDCRAYITYKEARGESLETIRAVLDVVENRMKTYNETCLQVARKKGQFPYINKHTNFKVSKEWLHKYEIVVMMNPVLGRDYLFFNTRKFKWGKSCKKIGSLTFCK